MTAEKQPTAPTFEEAFNQLQEAVQALEAGNLTLEESMRLFDKGMKLAKTCNELLSSAELKVSRLQRSFGEQMQMVAAEEPDLEIAEHGETSVDGA